MITEAGLDTAIVLSVKCILLILKLYEMNEMTMFLRGCFAENHVTN